MSCSEQALAMSGSDVPGTTIPFLLLPFLTGMAPADYSSVGMASALANSIFSQLLMGAIILQGSIGRSLQSLLVQQNQMAGWEVMTDEYCWMVINIGDDHRVSTILKGFCTVYKTSSGFLDSRPSLIFRSSRISTNSSYFLTSTPSFQRCRILLPAMMEFFHVSGEQFCPLSRKKQQATNRSKLARMTVTGSMMSQERLKQMKQCRTATCVKMKVENSFTLFSAFSFSRCSIRRMLSSNDSILPYTTFSSSLQRSLSSLILSLPSTTFFIMWLCRAPLQILSHPSNSRSVSVTTGQIIQEPSVCAKMGDLGVLMRGQLVKTKQKLLLSWMKKLSRMTLRMGTPGQQLLQCTSQKAQN